MRLTGRTCRMSSSGKVSDADELGVTMAKKSSKKQDSKDLEALLNAVLEELETLSAEQASTARQVRRLKKQLDGVKFCNCGKPKKKKNKKKKKASRNEEMSGVETVLDPAIEEGITQAMPVGLLNIVSEPVGGVADDLKWIAGVGPKLEDTLNELGVFHFEQIANWDQAEIDWVDEYLQFSGRIERDNWIEQAKALAKGG